jgi:hypothetical protein
VLSTSLTLLVSPTVTLNGPVTAVLGDDGRGGKFSPESITLTSTTTSASPITVTYTPPTANFMKGASLSFTAVLSGASAADSLLVGTGSYPFRALGQITVTPSIAAGTGINEKTPVVLTITLNPASDTAVQIGGSDADPFKAGLLAISSHGFVSPTQAVIGGSRPSSTLTYTPFIFNTDGIPISIFIYEDEDIGGVEDSYQTAVITYHHGSAGDHEGGTGTNANGKNYNQNLFTHYWSSTTWSDGRRHITPRTHDTSQARHHLCHLRRRISRMKRCNWPCVCAVR